MSDSLRWTERRNPRSVGIDRRSVEEMLEIFLEEDRRAVEAVAAVKEQVAAVIERVVRSLREGGRLIYVGAGTSGRLGVLDASECPPTFGVPPGLIEGIIAGGDRALRRSVEAAEDDLQAGAAAVRAYGVGPQDVVLGIATSGRTPYVLGALQEAHRLGAWTVLLLCTPPDRALQAYVDQFIVPLVGPEIIAGSTRLKAGTATKLILNQISTIAMIRCGKVYDNWMVDLRASNSKLRERAVRMVVEIAGVERSCAEKVLHQADWEVKTALLMLATGLDAQGARRRLERHHGVLREALEGSSWSSGKSE